MEPGKIISRGALRQSSATAAPADRRRNRAQECRHGLVAAWPPPGHSFALVNDF